MSKQWKSGNTPENIPKDSRKGIYEIWEYVGCSVVLGSDHINLEKNTKVRYWKVVKHVKKEVGNRFVPCSSSVPCYPHPSIPPLHSASLPSLFYPLLFLSLPQIQNMSSLLPFPSVTPPPCRHTHTHTHQHTNTVFIWSHRACTSMADRHIRRQHRQLKRRFSASFPQRSSFSRFFCFFKKEEKWKKIIV